MERECIDARGLPCPQPVIKAREAISRAGVSCICMLVDDLAQAENVIAMARNQSWSGKITKQDKSCIEIALAREDITAIGVEAEDIACGTRTNLVVLISSSYFGEGDDDLGALLIRAFIKTLRETAPRPASLIFINGGVKLTTEGSALIEDIRQLADGGTEVLSCGTCLDFYNLKDKLLAGRISNMFEITSQLVSADRVLRP